MKLRFYRLPFLIITAVIGFNVLPHFSRIGLATERTPANEEEKEKKENHDEKKEEEKTSESAIGVGPGKSVLEASQKEGLRLSETAISSLGIKTAPISSEGTHRLPQKSVIYFQAEAGVYRLRGGWFKLIELKDYTKSSSEVMARTPELKPGDQIVTVGASLLRLAELNVWGGAEGGE